MTNVVILGGTGMLGSMLVDVFSKDERFHVEASYHGRRPLPTEEGRVRWFPFEACGPLICERVPGIGSWVINAIGAIPQRGADRRRMIKANTQLPQDLALRASGHGFRVIHATTDCVFSGAGCWYKEAEEHDGTSDYARTKSLGEAQIGNVLNLRCSIVGPEPRPGGSGLLEWFLSLPKGSEVDGWTDWWNGITTLAWAKIAKGIVLSTDPLNGTYHVIPHDSATKAELLDVFRRTYGRTDVYVKEVNKDRDMRLDTSHARVNERLWRDAGYDGVPEIGELVREQAEYDYAFEWRDTRKPAVCTECGSLELSLGSHDQPSAVCADCGAEQ
jgi:dTDP-4-dehydrorhamnose reductase